MIFKLGLRILGRQRLNSCLSTQRISRGLGISITFLVQDNPRVLFFIFLFHFRLIRPLYFVDNECSMLHPVQVWLCCAWLWSSRYVRSLVDGISPSFSTIVNLFNSSIPHLFLTCVGKPNWFCRWALVPIISICKTHIMYMHNKVGIGDSQYKRCP